MDIEDTLDKVEGNAFTIGEYDTLVLAAMNGGLIPFPEDLDLPPVELPEGLMPWLKFCERVREDNAILHLVLIGVLVPTQLDELDSEGYPGYRYKKSDNADAIIENLGAGRL